MLRRLLSLGTLLAISTWAFAACGDGSTPPSSPTATLTATATATAAPTPTSTPAGPQVRWVPAELPVFTGQEAEDPFAGVTGGLPSQWSVYLVRGDGEPELVYQTRRWLWSWSLRWSADGTTLIIPFASQSASYVATGACAYGYDLSGAVFLEIGDPGTTLTELVFYLGSIIPSPDGSRLALYFQRPSYEDCPGTQGLYVTERGGHAVKLERLYEADLFVLAWLPDGSGLLADALRTSRSPLYVAPIDGPPILVMPRGPEVAFHYRTALSPDGGRLAYLSEGDLYIFDLSRGTSRQLSTGGRYRHAISLPQWSVDGRLIIVGGDAIDAATGDVVASLLPSSKTISATLSPDSRYFLAAEEPTWEPSLANRVHLLDLQTGQTRVLLEKDHGFYWGLGWLPDARHLLLITPSCWGCDTLTMRVSLMDLESGRMTPLTDGLEPHGAAYPSPDGQRLLVTGKALRLYTVDGQLLWEFPAPEGFDVAAAAWSSAQARPRLRWRSSSMSCADTT